MFKTFIKSASSLLLVGSVFFASCDKVIENPTTDSGRNYLPLEIGHWVLYDVDSVYWDDYTRTMYPVKSQQRYEIVDTFRDTENRLSYTINVYSRKATTSAFIPDRVIHVTPLNNRIEWNEKNITLINLIFPVVENNSWNGASMVSNIDPSIPEFYTDKWNFEYKNVGQPFDGDVKYFDNTVTVHQINDSLNNPDTDSTAYAYKNYSKEIYAANVGMVRKERIYWVFQPKPGGSGYRKGYGVTMTAVDYKE